MRWAPTEARPRVQLARVSPPDQALDYLLEAKRIAPDDPLVASELGKLFIERRQASEALSEFGGPSLCVRGTRLRLTIAAWRC